MNSPSSRVCSGRSTVASGSSRPHSTRRIHHAAFITSHPSQLIDHAAFITPHSSQLIDHASFITPHSSRLSLITPHEVRLAFDDTQVCGGAEALSAISRHLCERESRLILLLGGALSALLGAMKDAELFVRVWAPVFGADPITAVRSLNLIYQSSHGGGGSHDGGVLLFLFSAFFLSLTHSYQMSHPVLRVYISHGIFCMVVKAHTAART